MRRAEAGSHSMSEKTEAAGQRLDALIEEAGLASLDAQQRKRFSSYLSLLLRWNSRINLTAIREADQILARHFVESIACAQALPGGIGTLLDFGSGAGFPGIPIALCRPEIAVTLAESNGKKAAFLSEAARELEVRLSVHGQRAEQLTSKFDCVTLRAVDRMEQAVEAAAQLVNGGGWLAPLTTRGDLEQLQRAAGGQFVWEQTIPLPGGHERVLALGRAAGG